MTEIGNIERFEKVSLHGGHSGEFCCHAEDTLEDIVNAYICQKFFCVGISEHIPPVNDNFLYPDEKSAGLNAQSMFLRFSRYFAECRRLQKKYASEIKILVAFETETYTGSYAFIRNLTEQFAPDYIVGSVHHVRDIPIDYSASLYQQAADICGGLDRLYCEYFDLQYEMIQTLTPLVIGHFDLIRLFDADYVSRLQIPEIQAKIRRNLQLIKDSGLILDFNVRALYKGAAEPYISRSVLEIARDMNIAIVPGDDSHGVATAGLNVNKGIEILQEMGIRYDVRRVLKLLPELRHC